MFIFLLHFSSLFVTYLLYKKLQTKENLYIIKVAIYWNENESIESKQMIEWFNTTPVFIAKSLNIHFSEIFFFRCCFFFFEEKKELSIRHIIISCACVMVCVNEFAAYLLLYMVFCMALYYTNSINAIYSWVATKMRCNY